MVYDLMMAYDFMILNMKGVDYRCYVFIMSKNDAIKLLNNKSIIMYFRRNIKPIEVIKNRAFGGANFRDTYTGANGKWYKNSWKEFNVLKDIDQKYYCSSYYDVSVNKYGVKFETSLRFWENKGWIHSIDPCGWFQWYFRY